MYSIGYVIYGYPLTREIYEEIQRLDATVSEEVWGEKYEDLGEDWGFETTYSGSSTKTQGWIGFQLRVFNCFDEFPMSEIANLGPSEAHKVLTQRKISKLPESLRKLIKEPAMHIVFGTS